MRHGVFGKKLSRNTGQRQRLVKSLILSLFEKDQISTTLARAKAIQGEIDGLITKAKKNTNSGIREIHKIFQDSHANAQLMEWAKTRFSTRNSGYTRIIKVGTRKGDRAQTVLLTFVDPKPEAPKPAIKGAQEAEIVQKSTLKRPKSSKKLK